MSKTLLQHKWLIVFFTFSASFLMYFSIKNAQLGILSHTNAYLIEKAMLIRLTGHFELAGFVYPPIPFLFAMLYPNVLFFCGYWYCTMVLACNLLSSRYWVPND